MHGPGFCGKYAQIFVISVRFYVKSSHFAKSDYHVLKIKISQAFDTTLQKYSNLPLHY